MDQHPNTRTNMPEYNEAMTSLRAALERKRLAGVKPHGEIIEHVIHYTPRYVRAIVTYEDGETQRWTYGYGWQTYRETDRRYRARYNALYGDSIRAARRAARKAYPNAYK